MLSPGACRNSGSCFLLNAVQVYTTLQSNGSYFGLLTAERTPSCHPEAPFWQRLSTASPLLLPSRAAQCRVGSSRPAYCQHKDVASVLCIVQERENTLCSAQPPLTAFSLPLRFLWPLAASCRPAPPTALMQQEQAVLSEMCFSPAAELEEELVLFDLECSRIQAELQPPCRKEGYSGIWSAVLHP